MKMVRAGRTRDDTGEVNELLLSPPSYGGGRVGEGRSQDMSVRLDRQRLGLRPFAHRAVVERDVVVAELVQQEQVDGGRDAAAAIADRALVLRHAWLANLAAAS